MLTPGTGARCQCLTDEQPRAVPPLEALEGASRSGGPRATRERGTHMAHVRALQCRECGRTYDVAPLYSCEWCFGPLEVAYDEDAVAASVTRESIAAGPPTLWRYADLLPVGPTDGGLPVGLTPLVRADRLAEELGLG